MNEKLPADPDKQDPLPAAFVSGPIRECAWAYAPQWFTRMLDNNCRESELVPFIRASQEALVIHEWEHAGMAG